MTLLRSLALLCILGTIAGTAKADSDKEPASTLSVNGTATLRVPADQLRISLGIEVTAGTVSEAHEQAVEAMDAVVKAMNKLGLKAEKEYTIERYDVSPQWTPPPRPRNPEPNWKPAIVGYKITSQMRIRTARLDLAGKIISSGVDAGANDIGNVVFDLADPRTSRSEAIQDAAANALADAKVLAEAAGVKLVRIRSLSLDGASATPIYAKAEMAYGMAPRSAGAAAAPTMISGDVTVRANVSLVWEIEGP